MALKVFSLFFRVKVLVHATRGNLSQGGVLFYCDPNSYEDKDKGKFRRSGARPVAGGLGPKRSGTVRVVSELDMISTLSRVLPCYLDPL